MKTKLLYALVALFSLVFLAGCLLLPAHLALRAQKKQFGAVEILQMSALPTEKPSVEEACPYYDALALLYLRELHEDYVNKLTVSEAFDMEQAELRFREEYALLREAGFFLHEDDGAYRFSRDAYANAANDAVRAELLTVSVEYGAGYMRFTADADTGKILKIEQYWAPSDEQRALCEADARAFSGYLGIGELVFTGEEKGVYGIVTETFYAKEYDVKLALQYGGGYSLSAYPGAFADGGAS